MTRTALFVLILSGCTPGGETPHKPGSLELCIGGAHGEATVTDRYQRWTLSGTIVDASPTFDVGSCANGDGPTGTLSIDDGQGNITHLGWTATTENGAQDFTPDLDLTVGDSIVAEFASVIDWGADQVMAIHQDGELVFAGEEGYAASIDELDPTLLGDLDVSRGVSTWSLPSSDCGNRKSDTLVFESSETQVVDIWVEATIPVNGNPMQVRNVGAWSFDGQITCTDTWGPAPWIAFR